MKKIFALILFCLAGLVALPSHARADGGVSFGVFYSSLGSYGDWISVGADVYAWHPADVDPDWRPYTEGHWVWTDDGWYWASDEPWGWATYHYGRWYFDDAYGWLWVPGYDWSPAWVEWRYGGDYVGWAPLSPYAVWSVSFGIHYRNHWVTPVNYWSFVDCHHINAYDLHHYVYRSGDNTRFIGRTRGAGSVDYDHGRVITRGPDRQYVERRGNVRVQSGDIVDARNPRDARVIRDGNNRERIEAYRPTFNDRAIRGDATRPGTVRTPDRPVGLNPQDMDVRSHAVARDEGRDLQRAEQYRIQRQPNVTGQANRDYSIQRQAPLPQPPVDRTPRYDRQVERNPQVQVQRNDRPQRYQPDGYRPAPPERTVRRDNSGGTSQPHVSPAPQRSGGGRSGDGGGGSRGGGRRR